MAKLNVGDKMPNFKFNTATKDGLTVNEVLKGKTIFWVLRYIGCTSCNYDVCLIAENYEKFQAKGAQVYVVMQSDKKHLQDDLAIRPLPFEIISDDKMEIYKELEIMAVEDKAFLGPQTDEQKEYFAEKRANIQARGLTHGDYEGDELQLPAFFIVEEDGTVSYAHYASNIADMPTIEEALALL